MIVRSQTFVRCPSAIRKNSEKALLYGMPRAEKEGKIGSLHSYFYTTVGNGTSVANSKRFAAEFAQELRNDGVDAVILTST